MISGGLMDKKDFVKRLYAGIFFLIGIGLIVVVVLAIGMEKGLTQPKFQAAVLYRDVGGLSVGAPVRLSGVTIGTVAKIDFLDEQMKGRGVKVTLNIFRRYRKQFEKSSQFAIKTQGILGEKLVDIALSEQGKNFDVNQPIIGDDPLDVQDLAETFGDTAVSLSETSRAIDEMIEELSNITTATKRLMNRIEEKLMDGSLFKIF